MRASGEAHSSRLVLYLGLSLAAMFPNGTDALAKSSKSSSAVEIELNKLEAEGNDCQAYFVFDNKSSTNYQEFKVDLVVFRPDGVIERRFAMEIAPLEAEKRTVKLFELNETTCDEIGSLLINGVLACKASRKQKNDCLGQLVPQSRVDVELTK